MLEHSGAKRSSSQSPILSVVISLGLLSHLEDELQLNGNS